MRAKLLILAGGLWVWLAPIQGALGAVMALPLVDLALGLACARKAKRPITSAGLKRTVAKVFLYEFATVLAFVVESYMTGSLIPCIKMVTGLIGMAELKSCLEHLDELGGQPLFAALLSRLAPQQLDQLEPPTVSITDSPQDPNGPNE